MRHNRIIWEENLKEDLVQEFQIIKTKEFGSSFPNNRFDSSFSNNPNNEFDSRFLNSIGLGPRFTNQKNGPISQNQNTYLQPKENQLNLNAQSEQAIEAEVHVFGTMDFNREHLQSHEQQLQALFNPLFEQLIRKLQKLN